MTHNTNDFQNRSANDKRCQRLTQALVRLGKIFLIVVVALNILGPILFVIWPGFISHVIFQHFIHVPFRNLSDPAGFGLKETYAFRLEHEKSMIGAWHILPKDSLLVASENIEDHFHKNVHEINPKTGEKTILVIYLHGNTNDRSCGHRVGLYNLLSSYGYHVVAFDYRGYGDSTGEPTEQNVVSDALFIYEFLLKHARFAKIYLWGHSLGTGITSKMARILADQDRHVEGLILEAPFFNIVEEVELHPFTLLFPYNPILFKLIEENLKSHQIEFRSDIHLTKVKSKIIIMHAADDLVIPIYQSEKLFEVASKNGISENITYHRIPWYHNCGHRSLYLFENITEIIK